MKLRFMRLSEDEGDRFLDTQLFSLGSRARSDWTVQVSQRILEIPGQMRTSGMIPLWSAIYREYTKARYPRGYPDRIDDAFRSIQTPLKQRR